MSQVQHIALGELMASSAGSVNPAKFSDEIFDLYSIPAFDRGIPEIALGESIGSTKQIVRPGDVLLSKIVPHIRRSWVVGEERGRRLIASGEWIVFRSERIDQAYLRHVLVGDPFHSQFMQTVSGVGGSLLRARPVHVAKITVPLPKISEQRRIASILDQADALRAKRREALTQLDNLKHSIFVEMFGEPVENPKGWPILPFGNQFQSVRYGTGSPPPYVENGIPFIRATNIKMGRVSSRDLKNISVEDANKLSKCKVHHGNIIVVRSGVNTGDCAVIPAGYEGSCAAFDLIIDIDYANAVFFAFLINSDYGRRILEPLTRRAAQPHLNAEQLRSLLLMAPPEQLRAQFAKRIDAVEAVRVVHVAALSELDSLFAALQHRAFRGEL